MSGFSGMAGGTQRYLSIGEFSDGLSWEGTERDLQLERFCGATPRDLTIVVTNF